MLRVLKQAADQAIVLGLVGPGDNDYETVGKAMDTLRVMALNSAPVTHPQGNKRYDDFVLQVKNDYVVNVSSLNSAIGCDVCEYRGYSVMYEECPLCGGSGCGECRGSGELVRKIPCQECGNNKKPLDKRNIIRYR